jgi:TonB family protein
MRGIVIGLTVFILADVAFAAQREARSPAPTGQDIVARDGDRVIIEDSARVQILRRRQVMVRAVFNESLRYLILIVDYVTRPGELPDGNVDFAYRFNDVEGAWPLGARWEGFITLDEYAAATSPGLRAFGLSTPVGLIQILLGPPSTPEVQSLRDPSATGVLMARGSSSTSGRIPPYSFEQAEEDQIRQGAIRAGRQGGSSERGSAIAGVGGGLSTWSSSSVISGPRGDGAIRVGGGILAPKKIRDVLPVYPDDARQARVQGVVILEITVAADGSVADARVLRSISLLDAAAVAAVRQWQYEPTLLNGVAVPVIMTVTVNFSL